MHNLIKLRSSHAEVFRKKGVAKACNFIKKTDFGTGAFL